MRPLLERAQAGEVLSLPEIARLIDCSDPQLCRELYRAAYHVKEQFVGKKVYLRGRL